MTRTSFILKMDVFESMTYMCKAHSTQETAQSEASCIQTHAFGSDILGDGLSHCGSKETTRPPSSVSPFRYSMRCLPVSTPLSVPSSPVQPELQPSPPEFLDILRLIFFLLVYLFLKRHLLPPSQAPMEELQVSTVRRAETTTTSAVSESCLG